MIQILITGGTFDKSYNHISGDLFFEKTHIPEMLERSKCRLNVDVKTLMMIDSLEMTQKDIEKIIDECKKTKSSRIVITHGTDTMVNTAGKIAKKIKNKTIKLIDEKNFYEYYSCKNAKTLGANNFSWSAALYLDLILENSL